MGRAIAVPRAEGQRRHATGLLGFGCLTTQNGPAAVEDTGQRVGPCHPGAPQAVLREAGGLAHAIAMPQAEVNRVT